MSSRSILAAMAAFVILSVWWAIGRRSAAADEPAMPGTVRQGVELTVYKDDFGMVHEQRPSALQSGPNRLQVTEVSKQLDPQSVLLGWTGGQADIVAHSYDLGVANG